MAKSPEYYYARAEETQRLAEDMSNEEAKQGMLNVSRQYMLLGERKEIEILARDECQRTILKHI